MFGHVLPEGHCRTDPGHTQLTWERLGILKKLKGMDAWMDGCFPKSAIELQTSGFSPSNKVFISVNCFHSIKVKPGTYILKKSCSYPNLLVIVVLLLHFETETIASTLLDGTFKDKLSVRSCKSYDSLQSFLVRKSKPQKKKTKTQASMGTVKCTRLVVSVVQILDFKRWQGWKLNTIWS